MRNITENIYQQKVNLIIDYISSHLHEPLQLNTLASLINVSQRQLLRIMQTSLNESLYAYVARLRVERAVMYMQIEQGNLSLFAEKVGYDNAQSFSKAFKKHFGISPKNYLNQLQARLESYVKSSGNRLTNIHSEIVSEDKMELVYIRIWGKYGEEQAYKTAWQKLTRFLKDNNALSDATRFIGISFDDPNITEHKQCRFYACAIVFKKISPTGEFGTIQIPTGKYAVYTLDGSYSGLQELYNNISVNFDHTIRNGLAFEEYMNSPHDTDESRLRTKIYIPIK